MSWLRIRFRAERSLCDALSDALETSGAIAVAVQDAGGDGFYDAVTPKAADWAEVFVTGLFPGDVDVDACLASVDSRLGVRAVPPVEIDVLADEDWARSWARDYRALRITERLWICPSWIEPPDEQAINVIIDPGLAFGTGTHPTTRLCLQWLARADLRGRRIIDYGCGSGILAIAAVKLGAAHALAVDVDPHALNATRYNAARNGVTENITVTTCAAAPTDAANIVIANILANVIVSLHDTLCGLVLPRGQLLLTGILDSQLRRVATEFEDKFVFARQRREDWCLLVGRAA